MKHVTRDIDPRLAQDLLERVPRACLAFADAREAVPASLSAPERRGESVPASLTAPERRGGRPRVEPVRVVWQDGRCLVGFPADAGGRPAPGQEVVLLVDEGIYYFDLRAVYIRGYAQPTEAPAGNEAPPGNPGSAGAQAGETWFELVPSKTVAWDYGSMREVEADDEHR